MKTFVFAILGCLCACALAAETNVPATGGGPLVVANSLQIRSLAARALLQKCPGLDPSTLKPGHIVYLEPLDGRAASIFVEWIGRDAITVEKGVTPDVDRKKVRKLRVAMTPDGQILNVEDTFTWLQRATGGGGESSAATTNAPPAEAGAAAPAVRH